MSNIEGTIFNPFRWYDDKLKQNFRKEWIYNGLRYGVLLSPKNFLLPFQLQRKNSPDEITVFQLYDVRTETMEYDVLTNLTAATDLMIYTLNSVDNIVYYPKNDLKTDIPCGIYYAYLTDGTLEWWSEVFEIIDKEETMIIKGRPRLIPKLPQNVTIQVQANQLLVW